MHPPSFAARFYTYTDTWQDRRVRCEGLWYLHSLTLIRRIFVLILKDKNGKLQFAISKPPDKRRMGKMPQLG